MYMIRLSRCIFPIVCCCLMLLLASCGSSGTVNPTASQTAVTGSTPMPPSPTVTTAPVPPTQTNCPAPGTARTAVTAPLALGPHASIVYLVTQFSNGTPTNTFQRFDVVTGAKTEMLKLPNEVV